MKNRLTILFLFFASSLFAQKDNFYLLTGSYTSGSSKGIYVYRFNTTTGKADSVSMVASSNPSFLAVAPNQQWVYAVNENANDKGNGGSVSAFAFDKLKGQLQFLNSQSSEGNHPCYVTVDQTGHWVIAGNYSSGNFAVLPILTNGGVAPASQVVQQTGKGPDTTRQQSPHVHATFLKKNNHELLVPDLGTDKLFLYQFNAATGMATPAATPFASVQPGAGPRHVTVSNDGKFVYLVTELNGELTVFRDKGDLKLEAIQSIGTLPAGYNGPFGGADIHLSPDGRFLYSSNRGNANNLAIFSVNTKTGKLRQAGFQSTLGIKPRNFSFDPTGKFLLVANQESDDIVIFRVNAKTGMLKDTGHRIHTGNPVCIKWIPVR